MFQILESIQIEGQSFRNDVTLVDGDIYGVIVIKVIFVKQLKDRKLNTVNHKTVTHFNGRDLYILQSVAKIQDMAKVCDVSRFKGRTRQAQSLADRMNLRRESKSVEEEKIWYHTSKAVSV